MAINKAIDKYFRQVPQFRSIDDAEKILKRRYGKAIVDTLLETISRRANGDRVDVYPLLYQSLEFSIDCMGAFQGSLPKDYLKWLSEIKMQPARILDLGCGNGFLTCFYSSLFPQSEIIGCDISPDAIRCANQLKNKVSADNVTFVQADSHHELAQLGGPYDLITLVTVANEIVSVPGFPNSLFMNEIFSSQVDIPPPDQVVSLCERLSQGGRLVTVNRWTGHGYCWWISVLQKCGLAVNYREGERLGDGDNGQAIALLSQRQSTSANFSADDAIAFWLYSDYQRQLRAQTFKPPRFMNELAESCFLQINPKRLRLGIKVTHRTQPGAMRVEIWQAGPFLVFFQSAVDGQKSLEILPTFLYSDVEERARHLVKEYTDEFVIADYFEPDSTDVPSNLHD